MRNPADAIKRLALMSELGLLIRELIDTAVIALPVLKEPARAILEGGEVQPLDEESMGKVMSALRKVLEPSDVPDKVAVAKTPINADILWGWGVNTQMTRTLPCLPGGCWKALL